MVLRAEQSPAKSASPTPIIKRPSTVWNPPIANSGLTWYMMRPVSTTRSTLAVSAIGTAAATTIAR